jgi:hypothetical protein
VDAAFEVAVGGSEPPTAAWRELGWSVRDSIDVSRSVAAYREYVASSRGELSVAKNVYVDAFTGWFSCRSACYLAAARPVVAQDTGFSSVLPVTAGLRSFTTPDEAVQAVRDVEADYEGSQQAARAVAEEHLDSDVVLGRLLEQVRVR